MIDNQLDIQLWQFIHKELKVVRKKSKAEKLPNSTI